ncbi:hypothetical protein [Klebsiella pneumoniae]|uniref:hypothetical protein n=1 Tax=Klebsiella pneumoniae TaxID=573 RepID=UPI0013021C95|nr:hypothetical protein [Klebsiella pneumoniae]
MTERDISNPIPRENYIDEHHNVNDDFPLEIITVENKSLARRFYSGAIAISDDEITQGD